MKVYKHIIQVVVLNEEKTLEQLVGDDWNLKDIAYAITNGDAIGGVNHISTELVPNDRVEKELIDVGNDGSFFEFGN
jgi:hypothetical protein